ncbi:peptidase family C50-domain-containing protein [Xylogone sp. PMI_703]|nr:peptidase family C50-domain-containing protein [Xylogone sp. PMI_703]
MAISQLTTDVIRIAVSSTATCTPETATLLADFLLPKHNKGSAEIISTQRNRSKSVSAPKTNGTKRPPSRPRSRAAEKDGQEPHGELSARERSILATEVINATLKSLSDAIKTQPAVRNQTSTKDPKESVRSDLRRSNSEVRSPLKPRSLNRVATAPNVSDCSNGLSCGTSPSSGERATAECARVAFSCLRTLQMSKSSGVDLPPLQIENGMSVLIGKLITLGLDDLALKELRILKRIIDPRSEPVAIKKPAQAPTKAYELVELLDFSGAELTGSKIGLAITTQLQCLRLMTSCRKNEAIEAALPLLQYSHPSSPINLLLFVAKEANQTQIQKIARQIQSFSELTLSLSPSISTTEDAIALDPKLNIRPDIAFQFQCIALNARLNWWLLVGHKGDPSKDILDPFSRCLSAFVRRNKSTSLKAYNIASSGFASLKIAISKYDASFSLGPETLLRGIYQLLCTLSQEAGCTEETRNWIEKIQPLHPPNDDSTAKSYAITARLVTLSLRSVPITPKTDERLLSLLEGLERPFKGQLSEIDDLLTEVSAVRRAAITLLAKSHSPTGDNSLEGWTTELQQMCESLVFICPRLSLRYLGNAPAPSSPAKEIVRFEQRRQFITKLALHAVDSALFLTKVLLGKGSLKWDLADSLLQDCLSLLDRSGPAATTPNDGETSTSPYVKISNLYYAQHISVFKESTMKDSQHLRILKKSIDCILPRPRHERNLAHLTTKLERIAGIYKKANRYDESLKALVTLRDEIIAGGALTVVANTAASRSLQYAWDQSEDTMALARVVESLLKVLLRQIELASQFEGVDTAWTNEEKGVVLEYQLKLLSSFDRSSNTMLLERNIFKALLAIYDENQFPIRRLRAITTFMSAQSHSIDTIEELKNSISSTEGVAQEFDDAKDVGLQQYKPHFQALLTTLKELRQDQPSVDVLKKSLSLWYSIYMRHEGIQDTQLHIEDVVGLVLHLHGIAEFLQMKGVDTIAVAVLQLITGLNELRNDSGRVDDEALSLIKLGMQWLHLGYSEKAAQALDKAEDICRESAVSLQTKVQLQLSYSEYLLTVGDMRKCEERLLSAKELFMEGGGSFPYSTSAKRSQKRTIKHQVISNAYLIYSILALQRGLPEDALTYAKHSVRLLRRAWSIIEEESQDSEHIASTSPRTELDKLTEEVSQLNLSTLTSPRSAPAPAPSSKASGSEFWALIRPLFRSLSHLSNLYAHHGMFQETIYYSEQALRVVKGLRSQLYAALGCGLLGNAWLRAGDLEKSAEYLMEAKVFYSTEEKSYFTAMLSYYTGRLNGKQGNYDAELAAYEETESILLSLKSMDFIDSVDRLLLPQRPSIEVIPATKQRKASTKRAIAAGRKPAVKRVVSKIKPVIEPAVSVNVDCPQITSLYSLILRRKAEALGLLKRCDEALAVLRQAEGCSEKLGDTFDQGIVMAKHLLLHSIEELSGDPVYGSLQDSTISFPSISDSSLSLEGSLVGQQLTKISSMKKKTASKRGTAKSVPASSVPNSFFDRLRQAHDVLTTVHSRALTIAPVSVVHTISSLLNSLAILLSAASYKGKPPANPSLANCFLEIARTLALRRERSAILIDQHSKQITDSSSWPSSLPSYPPSSHLEEYYNVSQFQQDYVDIIPRSWSVISMSLSDSLQELTITKLQSGHSPFVLRLPLTRHSALDPDEEVFDFEQGRCELLEIIDLTNQSAHDARDMTAKGAKAAWWEEREALDARLRDLLENVERVWLGGFRGVFSQEERRPDLLASFQATFQNTLDKHLPSRRQAGKKGTGHRVSLDARILDLFIGLGDPSDDEDFSESLNDLLYFIVDVLQFNGEVNAYDEIDVDSILVETQEALRCYHDAARDDPSSEEQRHTILILDKALHAFPWESLPCMNGHAVSRLPSLGCLRDRILEQQKHRADNTERYYVSGSSGSYILNPGGDLKSTQATFEKTLRELDEWDGIIKREPSENEIKESLESKDIFLYFGHGSGAQYIRAREIRKLEKCAVTMLMGCSSGALTDAGEFEPYGPAINYMHAGCPALVATLWDVTDKDVDRFAKSTLQHWGLFQGSSDKTGSVRGGKSGKKKAGAAQPMCANMSLVEAVARGREACNLRYLNGAALCVYGVPVFLG